MRDSFQVDVHSATFEVDRKSVVEKFSENGIGAWGPTGPAQRGISVRIFGVPFRSGVKEELDGFFTGIGGGAVERGFAPGANVAHEGSGFDARLGGAVGIGAVSEQDSHDILLREAGRGDGGVKRGFEGLGLGEVGIGSLLEEKLAELPVSVEGGSVETKVVSQRVNRFAAGEEESDGADVAVIGAPADE